MPLRSKDSRLVALLGLGLATLLACGGTTGEPQDRVRKKPEEPAPAKADEPAPEEAGEHASAGLPGVQDDGSIVSAVDWFHGSFDEALAAAKKDDKLILVDVGAYWCPPCHELDEKTFVDPKVGEYLKKGYVSLHIDAEKGEGPELVERYHVQAYPTVLVLEASGVEKARLVDFIEPAALIEKLKAIESGGNVLAELGKKVEENPGDLEALYDYGHALALAARRDQAEKAFAQVLAGDPDNARGLAAKVMYDRAMFFAFKLDKNNEGAIAQYRALQEKFPDSKQALRAYRQIGRVLNTMGKPAEAIESLDAMVAKKPDDVGLKSSYGWFCFRQKCMPQRGLEVVKQGIEQDPEAAGLYYLAAELEHLLGNHKAALTAIKKASELEPKKAYYRRQVTRFEDLAGKTG